MDKKKIIVVVADGCVEAVFTNGEGDFELEVFPAEGDREEYRSQSKDSEHIEDI